MKTWREDYIRQILSERQHDPVALSALAAQCINTPQGISGFHADTYHLLFMALAANSRDIITRRHQAKSNPDPNATPIWPTEQDHAFTNAYYALVPHMPDFGYNTAYKDKFFNFITNTIFDTSINRITKEDFPKLTLTEKITYMDDLATCFLDRYDPDRLIHQNNTFPNPQYIYSALKPFNEESADVNLNTMASFIPGYNIIAVNTYLVKQDNEGAIDYEGSRALCHTYDVNENLPYAVDYVQQGLHRQYQTQDLQLLTELPTRHHALSILSHELFHLANCRLNDIGTAQPELIENRFSFGKSDQAVYLASSAAYESFGTRYHHNMEEIGAYDIQGRYDRMAANRMPTTP